MANNVLNWAVKIKHIPPSEKFVLVMMGDQANKDGALYPAVGTLGDDCNMSERHARRILRRLEIYGLVRSEQRYRSDGTYTSRIYFLQITIDPTTWQPPSSKPPADKTEMTLMRHRFFEAMKNLMIQQAEQLGGLQSYNTWLAPVRIFSIEHNGARLVLAVPNHHFVTKVREKFSSIIVDAARATITPKIRRFHLVVK